MFSFGEATNLEKENSDFRSVKLRLKIDHVSYPTRAEGLVNMINVTLTTTTSSVRLDLGEMIMKTVTTHSSELHDRGPTTDL